MRCRDCGREITFVSELNVWLLVYLRQPDDDPDAMYRCGGNSRHRPIDLATVKRDLTRVFLS